MPTLRIASIRIDLKGPEHPPGGWGELTPFLIPRGAAGTAADARLAWRSLDRLPDPSHFWEAVFEDFQDGSVAFRRGDFVGHLDPVSGEGELETSSSPSALRAALRYVVALGLLEKDGLLLHAAALLVELHRPEALVLAAEVDVDHLAGVPAEHGDGGGE